MRKLKLFSLVITMALVLSFGMKVNAATETYTAAEELAIEKLANTKVMIGTENGFEGKTNLTRSQAAAIMVRVKGISEEEVEKERKKQAPVFKDVKKDHWAVGYINIAYAYGLVKGVSATEFNPEAKVKISELVTMAARSLGAGNMIDDYSEAWPDNYMKFANEEKILKDITSGKNADATRCETALIVSKTLEADTWKVSGATTSKEGTKNIYARQKGQNLLKSLFNIERYVDETVDSVSKTKKTATFGKNAEGKKSSIPTSDVDTTTVDLSKVSVNDNVEVWYNTKTKKIVFMKKVTKGSSNVEKEQDFAYITKYTQSTGKITLTINGKSENYYISNADNSKEIAEYNGKKKTKKELDELFMKSSTNLKELCGKVVVTGTDIDYIYLGDYSKVGVVSSTSSTKINFYDDKTVVGTTAPSKLTASDDDMIVTNLDGEKLDRDAIKEGFIVKYYYDETNKKYHVMTYCKVEKGEVDSRSSSQIEIDGEDFDVNFIGTYTKPSTGDDIKVYLNSADEVIMYTTDSSLYRYSEDDEDEADDDDDDEIDAAVGVITRAYKSGSKVYLSIDKATKKELDVNEVYDLFEDDFDDEDELIEYIIEECVGSFVQYEVKDSKYILYQFGEYVEDDLVSDRIVTPTSKIKLNKTNKTIGSYTYNTSVKVYECVSERNSSTDYESTKTSISLSDLSNTNYYVSLFLTSGKVTQMTVIVNESLITPVQPVQPVDTIETEGVVQECSDVKDNNYTVKIITNSGLKSYRVFGNILNKDELTTGSYIKYKLDSTTKDLITEGTITQLDKEKLIKCKINEIKTSEKNIYYRLDGDNDIKWANYDKFFYVKVGTITDTEEKFEVKTLSYTTTAPALTNINKTYTESGAECYMYVLNDKVVAVLYK